MKTASPSPAPRTRTLDGVRIAVTGGHSRLGRFLTKALRERGAHVLHVSGEARTKDPRRSAGPWEALARMK